MGCAHDQVWALYVRKNYKAENTGIWNLKDKTNSFLIPIGSFLLLFSVAHTWLTVQVTFLQVHCFEDCMKQYVTQGVQATFKKSCTLLHTWPISVTFLIFLRETFHSSFRDTNSEQNGPFCVLNMSFQFPFSHPSFINFYISDCTNILSTYYTQIQPALGKHCFHIVKEMNFTLTICHHFF